MRLCERSEAISLACGVHCKEIAASLTLLAKTAKLEVPLSKFIKSEAKQSHKAEPVTRRLLRFARNDGCFQG